MLELPAKIEEIREIIREKTRELDRLEQLWEQYSQQANTRRNYLCSKEVLALIKERSGQTKTMTSIKRWADEGLLGERIEEREHFPLLGHKQGNKRFLYPKSVVYPFLAAKLLIQPAFDILDRVLFTVQGMECSAVGVVIQFQLVADEFVYTVQIEQTGEIIEGLRETLLRMVEEEV